jgi:hypothetical protein
MSVLMKLSGLLAGPQAQVRHAGYAGLTLLCLLLGFYGTPVLNPYYEQRAFVLILFCAMQLLPVASVFSATGKRLSPAVVHVVLVLFYFLILFVANLYFPQIKQHLAWLFYGFALGLILCAVWAALLAYRSMPKAEFYSPKDTAR